MTRDPSSCLPGDSVATAAKIMKQQDVGPVLVVSDNSELRLVGIVTDRDIAVNVVAEGRDPYSTRVDSIMSSSLVTCREDEDVSRAVKQMAEYQVRRIPVVDENNRVVGIIAQADIARSGQDEQVGELVEDISQPYGSGEWSGSEFEASRSSLRGSRRRIGPRHRSALYRLRSRPDVPLRSIPRPPQKNANRRERLRVLEQPRSGSPANHWRHHFKVRQSGSAGP